jgi:hypothetical protein
MNKIAFRESQIKTYLIDCKGYSEEDVDEAIKESNLKDLMTDEDYDILDEYFK